MKHKLLISDSIDTCLFSGKCLNCGKMSVGHKTIAALKKVFASKKCIKRFRQGH